MSSTAWKSAFVGVCLGLSTLAGAQETTSPAAALPPGSPDPTETVRSLVNDPMIRDFVGPSENAWDFTAPNGVPGFTAGLSE